MREPRFRAYSARYHISLEKPLGLGPGQDGIVMRSDRATAIKFFDHVHRFRRELEVYQTLAAKHINNIGGHAVPELIRYDDELTAIEMTIVRPPFILDFAAAKLPDEVPDFEPHVMETELERVQDVFGDRWSDALHVAALFRVATGFVLLDIHPGNIAFGQP